MNLKWNVFRYDINKNEIVTFNIFDHWRFEEDVQKSLKKFKDKDEFAEQLRRDLRYYFWSKCEYEVIISSFPVYITMNELDRLNSERVEHKEKWGKDYFRISVCPDAGSKIDIYEQVMNNWDIFLDYVWNSKKRRKNKDAVCKTTNLPCCYCQPVCNSREDN